MSVLPGDANVGRAVVTFVLSHMTEALLWQAKSVHVMMYVRRFDDETKAD